MDDGLKAIYDHAEQVASVYKADVSPYSGSIDLPALGLSFAWVALGRGRGAAPHAR